MAPKKQAKSSDSQTKESISRSDSQSLDASQDVDYASKINEAVKVKNESAKEKRRERKKTILADHNARVEKLHSDIEQCVQKHDEEIRAIRRPKVQQLVELVNQKRELEARVDKCQAGLEQAYLSTAQQLQVAFDGRVEEMNG
ncbi:hypothetical protein LTR37_018477 [Vermiconidia calcicola]|uniref:Uncharacterized protein n=1 Tax=Vermiconidia calcicola TaxID=1690605 RepID=A0ACC3MH24_9PEZI|nr:hypothetical protein LTR37_018477 [Vermiconidia calcicola]